MSSTRISRHVNAPRPIVYRALLDARAVAKWMVPTGMTSHVHEFDPREGGSFRISLTYDTPTGTGKTTAHTDTYHGRFVRLVTNSRSSPSRPPRASIMLAVVLSSVHGRALRQQLVAQGAQPTELRSRDVGHGRLQRARLGPGRQPDVHDLR
ncbi:MAG: SRPBCC domain-containing protein, partial [Candidatus Methanoperedens sp.]|nr:SRPBCC domain-containing protein [Candidatus Methanoperedens sp.]